jgi:hypothetical protein
MLTFLTFKPLVYNVDKISLVSYLLTMCVVHVPYNWINIFMLCKLQHGKITGIWYLQMSKAWQVVDCDRLDWCNLIIIQKPANYYIRTKYNDNLKRHM